MDIRTKVIDHIDYDLPNGMTFQAYAASLIEVGFSEMLPAIIHEYHHNIVKVIPRWMRAFVSVPDADRLSNLLTSHLSPAGVNMLLAHYAGNENYVHDAGIQKEELLKSVDDLIRDVAKESSGSFALITEKLLHRMDIVKKAKQAASSIWDNTMTASLDNRTQKIDLNEPINDLYLTLHMEEPFDNKNENNFYAQNTSVKDTLINSSEVAIDNERFSTIPQLAILEKRKKKYISE